MSRHGAADESSTGRAEEQNPSREDNVEKASLMRKILKSVLARVFCVPDLPRDDERNEVREDEVPFDEGIFQEIQTITPFEIREVRDNVAQTELTCRPRDSNSKLLDKYEQERNLMQDILQECFVKGIETRAIVDNLINEIIEQGASIIKYPQKDQVTQTITTYHSHEDREENILRKLRIPVVVDPFEGSIVIVPLLDEVLDLTLNRVSRDARYVVQNILNRLTQRIIVIEKRLAEMRKRSEPSIEQIFDQRRKRIIESMKRETKTAVVQTGLAGVPEVVKLQEPKEILCSICARQSICQMCVEAKKEQDDTSLPLQDTKILHTRDILLAYNPCYVIATVSERARNPHLQSIDLTRREIMKSPISQFPQHTTDEKLQEISNEFTKVVLTPKKNTQTRDSVSGWAQIIDDTVLNSWSFKGSANNTTSIIATSSSTKSISNSCCMESFQSDNVMDLQATKALQILKNTFCTRDTCPTILSAVLRKSQAVSRSISEKSMSCNLKSCKLLNLNQCSSIRRHTNNISAHIYARQQRDKFKIKLVSRNPENECNNKNDCYPTLYSNIK